MRFLITGGAGFLGSHVVDLALRRGHEVDVIDDLSTGSRTNLRARKRLRVIASDVSRARFPRARYDAIFHLASPASPRAYLRHGVKTLLVNALGTKRVLDRALRDGADVLIASTSEVYGDPLVSPQPESYWGNVNPVGPRCAYDEGKRYAEALTVTYARTLGVRARIARIFNSYGPRMRPDDGRMPAAFIVAALRNLPIEVEGDGSQTRSLCYVSDTALGLWHALARGQVGSVYNIGRPEEISVLAFAKLVRELVGSLSTIVFVPGRPEEIRRRRPDISRARRELKWSPATQLRVGLRRTIRWYRTREPR